jgi:pimeloyl-ACP methyl ester carboxylesterase
MMPFSVLRIWGTGLLSWAILAGGIYCLWEWADGIDPAVVNRSERDPETGEIMIVSRRVPEETRDAQGGWPYLAAGITLLAFSGGGFLPVTLILGNPGTSYPRPETDGEHHVVRQKDGSVLHVEIHGPKHGPTLVFTHGWSLDGTVWNYAQRDLSKRFRLVVWDLPGLGKSRGPGNDDYSLDKMAHDLAAIVQMAGKGPIILVGHSVGGMITQTFCRLYPKQFGPRVAGIVLMHTTFTNPLRTAFLAPLWTAIEKPILVPLNHLTIWLAPLAWLSNWQSYLNGSLHIVTRIASFAGRQTWGQLNYGALLAAKAWPAVVARGNLAMLQFDEQVTLPNVEVPVLVISAKHDRMTKPSASEHIEQLLPHGLYASVDSGHLGFWEQRARIAELISEFAERFEDSTTTSKAPRTALDRAGPSTPA